MKSDVEEGIDCSGAYLVWEDLTAVIRNDRSSRRLIDGLTGYALPGRITAIMGPSGSGKSTLLDSLAGRVSNNVVLKGSVLLNGRKQRLEYGVVVIKTLINYWIFQILGFTGLSIIVYRRLTSRKRTRCWER